MGGLINVTDLDAPFELSAEQRAVVESPIDRRLLVVAGAGQGKTEVVAARIGYLIENEDLSSSTETLVLSFSRAAVTAVRNRLDAKGIAQSNVRTFDSFAGQLLLDADVEPIGSFEARIRQATRILAESRETPYHVESLRHIVVDEVQDLVGDRADFVLALLRAIDTSVGITALGDPLQGIYDFQLEQSQIKTSSSEVFASLEGEFGAEGVGLGRSYRARGRDPLDVVSLGDRLRVTTDAADASRELDDFESELLALGEIEDWADSADVPGASTAILCTTNGEVLRVSKYLNDNGIRHVVRRQAQDFGASKWVAQALGELQGPLVGRSEVEAALERILGSEKGNDAWFELKTAEGNGRQRDSLNLSRLRMLIRSGAIPRTLTEPDNSGVVVSTVHRAKGLEFDRVFVVEQSYERKDADPWSAIRARYVALSRARDEVFLCSLPKTYSSFREERWLPGRLLERVNKWKSTKKRTKSVEFLYGDVDVDVPLVGNGGDAMAIQAALGASDLVGANLEAILDLENSTVELPSYLLVTDDGQVLGRTSEAFNQAFAKAFSLSGGSWPATARGLSVVSIETVAGDYRKSQQMDVSYSGMWLAPRVVGLAEPDWSMMEEVQ